MVISNPGNENFHIRRAKLKCQNAVKKKKGLADDKCVYKHMILNTYTSTMYACMYKVVFPGIFGLKFFRSEMDVVTRRRGSVLGQPGLTRPLYTGGKVTPKKSGLR